MRIDLPLALCLLAATLAASGCREPTAPDIPEPDLAGMEPQVVETLERVRRAVVDAPASAEAWGNLGAAYHAHGLLRHAETSYSVATDLAPEEFRWRYLLAVTREADGATADELSSLYGAAESLRGDYAALHLRWGLALSREGRNDEARDRLARAVELDPDSARGLRALGQVAQAEGNTESALVFLGRAAQIEPEDAAIYSVLARVYMEMDRPDAAHEASERASRLQVRNDIPDPVFEDTVSAAATSAAHGVFHVRELLAEDRPAEALEESEQLRQIHPEDPDIRFLAATSLRRLGQADRAAQELRAILESHPGHTRSSLELAGILVRQGQIPIAIEYLESAQHLAPGDPVLLFRLAEARAAAGDIDGVLGAYQMLAELSPHEAGIQLNLGTAWGRKGELARAEQAFREALRLDPDHVEAHFRLGVALELQGRPAEALEEFRETVRLEASHPARRRLREADRSGTERLDPAEEFRRVADALYGGHNRYLGRAKLADKRREIDGGTLTGSRLVDAHAKLARYLLEAGELEAAESEVQHAIALTDGLAWSESLRELHRLRGLVFMRQAEVQNCVLRHNTDSCIFPLRGGAIHTERGPARKALEAFSDLLARDPDDLESRWLLNVMSMALGEYPDGIDSSSRIPPAAFESAVEIGRFRDRAPELGVDTFNLCGGVVVDDFDRDGFLDIATSTYDPAGSLTLYRSDGRGGYEDRSRESGLAAQLGGLNVIGADYDGDGDTDLMVLRGAWLFDDGRIRNSLLRNDGDGTFTDVTRSAGLAEPAYPTQAAAWADLDNDGDLDLYVCNESRKGQPVDRADFPSQLFVNRGNGTFVDAARRAGVTNDSYCKGVTAGDYDNDGDIDLYLSNVDDNRLYRNEGGLRFVDVAAEAGVTEPRGRSFATWFFDYDNDGWLDIFVAAFDATIADLAAAGLDRPFAARPPRLYRNNGDGTFRDVAGELGLARPFLPMGANFGDVDNDGWLDIYLATGDPSYETLMPNVMLRNDSGRRFQDVTTSAGLGHLQKGHGVAFADLDHDGDLDLYHQLGGFFPGDGFHNALFENPGHGNHWLAVSLSGTRSVRSGYGARIRVVVETLAGTREIHRAAGSVSSFGGSPGREWIGLGTATRIRRLEVFWPASGVRQVFKDPGIDRLVRITERRDRLEVIPLPPARWARSAR